MADQLLLGGHGLATRTTAQVEAELRKRLTGRGGVVWQAESWALDAAEWACPGLEAARRCRRPAHCSLRGCSEDPDHRGEPWACRVRREAP